MNGASDPDDPKGLIREVYRIEGITDYECRSVLVDWALSLPPQVDPRAALRRLGQRYAAANPAHPMSPLLTAAHDQPASAPTRRGGAAGRRDNSH